MPYLDPTRIKVATHGSPVWATEATFQQILAAQLQHAPWILISAIFHAVAISLLYVLIPPSRHPETTLKVEVDLRKDEKLEELPPPPPPPPVEEKVKEPIIQDNQIRETDPQDVSERNFEDFASNAKESAFDSNQWNSAVGLGGGAGGRYGGRGGGHGGGSVPGGKATAQSIEAALKWLQDHQDEDGRWDADGFMKHDEGPEKCDGPGNGVHDVGVSGLALLAFLGDGSTLRSGPYKENLKRGIKWLKDNQQENGLFGNNASSDFIYDHAIAAYAMTEAYGLSQYSLLKTPAQKGINYLESHRNPYSVWRYQPRDNDNDTSVTGWCIMACESGRYFGLQVDEQTLKLCIVWLDSVTDLTGHCGYTKMGEPSSRHPGDHGTRFPIEKGEALTAVGLFCRFFLDQDPKEVPVMKAAADLILAHPPVWDVQGGAIDHYYWYYATYALYQMGGRHWSEWSKRLTDAVVKQQRKEPECAAGSWDPIGVWGEDGGRVYSTAILALTLEAYYRYTRLVR